MSPNHASDPVYVSPYYDANPSQLGGGAFLIPDLGGGSIGLARFHLHEKGCIPAHADTALGHGVLETTFVPSGGGRPVVVEIEFYGPIQKGVQNLSWSSQVRVDVGVPIEMTTPVATNNWSSCLA